jgi:hypothetical protein
MIGLILAVSLAGPIFSPTTGVPAAYCLTTYAGTCLPPAKEICDFLRKELPFATGDITVTTTDGALNCPAGPHWEKPATSPMTATPNWRPNNLLVDPDFVR